LNSGLRGGRQVFRSSRTALSLAALASILLASPSAAANGTPPHDGSTLAKPIGLSGTSWTTVLSSALQTSQKRNLQASGWLDLVNTGSKPVTVTLRFFDKPKGGPIDIHPGRERVTVPAHSRASAPVLLLCNGEPAGSYALGVQGRSSGPVTVRSGSETALALPAPGTGAYLPNAGVVRTTAMAIGQSDSTVMKTILSNGSATSTAAVQPVNALVATAIDIQGASKRTTVTLDYYMDGTRMGTLHQTVPANAYNAILAYFLCNEVPAGDHVFSVMARADIPGPHAVLGNLTVVGLPTAGVIPNNAAFGDGSVHSLSTKPQPFLKQTLKTGSVSDVWMGGWLTIHNPSDKPAVVTVQAAMGGGAEGPSVVVTAPARSTTSVPVGLLCNGEPAGSSVLELLVSSNIIGPDFNGDGVLASFALPQ